MECRQAQQHISVYYDGDAEDVLKQGIEEHLKVCSPCAKAYAQHRAAWAMLDLWEDAAPPAGLTKKILSHLPGRIRSGWMKTALPAAAAVIIIFAAVLYYAGQLDRKAGEIIAEIKVKQPSGYASISEEEIIAHLDILEEEEFFDSLEELVKIDYLPLMYEPAGFNNDNERSSLDSELT